MIEAAGVAIFRLGPSDGMGETVAVIHRPHHEDWSLPKGKREPGESLPEAAVREVLEETGLRITLGHPLTTAHYRVEGIDKVVHYWRSNVVEGEFVASDEADQLEWMTPAEALQRLTYAHDRALVTEAAATPTTVPLLLVRHADAGDGETWRASGNDDEQRPLSQLGMRAVPLVRGIALAYGARHVFSSTAERCQQTVQGLRDHVQWHDEPNLVDFLAAGQQGLLEVIERALATNEPSVMCTHGDQLDWLVQHWGIHPFTFSKGGTLVVHRDAASPDRILTTEWYPAPSH